MFSANLEQRLLKNNNPVDTSVHEGFILNELIKSFVTRAIPLHRKHFAVLDAKPFRDKLYSSGRLYVLVEHPNSPESDPEYRRVIEVDGRVLVLESPLNYTPREGSCVQALLGLEWKYVDERELDKMEKKEGKYRWV